VRAAHARAALGARVVGIHHFGVQDAICAVANGNRGGATGESIHARRARAEQRQLIATRGEDAVKLQVRAENAIKVEALAARRSNRALQRGEQEALDLCAIGGGERESRHGAEWATALAGKVQSHQAHGGTVTADARQEILQRAAQREAQLLYRGERLVERLARHEAAGERHGSNCLYILPAGEGDQEPGN
jgi:hypothetical protein